MGQDMQDPINELLELIIIEKNGSACVRISIKYKFNKMLNYKYNSLASNDNQKQRSHTKLCMNKVEYSVKEAKIDLLLLKNMKLSMMVVILS